MIKKKCLKCGKCKELIEFHKDQSRKDSRKNWCKECRSIIAKSYYEQNRDKMKEQQKEYSRRHKQEKKVYHKDWYGKNKEKISKQHRCYYNHHREEIQKRLNRNYVIRYRIDTKFNLNRRMKNLIGYSLKRGKNGRNWESLVGYNAENLKKHLEKTIPEGFTWEDYLEGKLEIDHIIPISVFNFSKPEQADFQRCWSLKNLRLILAEENKKKSNKLNKPFQPLLALTLE